MNSANKEQRNSAKRKAVVLEYQIVETETSPVKSVNNASDNFVDLSNISSPITAFQEKGTYNDEKSRKRNNSFDRNAQQGSCEDPIDLTADVIYDFGGTDLYCAHTGRIEAKLDKDSVKINNQNCAEKSRPVNQYDFSNNIRMFQDVKKECRTSMNNLCHKETASNSCGDSVFDVLEACNQAACLKDRRIFKDESAVSYKVNIGKIDPLKSYDAEDGDGSKMQSKNAANSDRSVCEILDSSDDDISSNGLQERLTILRKTSQDKSDHHEIDQNEEQTREFRLNSIDIRSYEDQNQKKRQIAPDFVQQSSENIDPLKSKVGGNDDGLNKQSVEPANLDRRVCEILDSSDDDLARVSQSLAATKRKTNREKLDKSNEVKSETSNSPEGFDYMDCIDAPTGIVQQKQQEVTLSQIGLPRREQRVDINSLSSIVEQAQNEVKTSAVIDPLPLNLLNKPNSPSFEKFCKDLTFSICGGNNSTTLQAQPLSLKQGAATVPAENTNTQRIDEAREDLPNPQDDKYLLNKQNTNVVVRYPSQDTVVRYPSHGMQQTSQPLAMRQSHECCGSQSLRQSSSGQRFQQWNGGWLLSPPAQPTNAPFFHNPFPCIYPTSSQIPQTCHQNLCHNTPSLQQHLHNHTSGTPLYVMQQQTAQHRLHNSHHVSTLSQPRNQAATNSPNIFTQNLLARPVHNVVPRNLQKENAFPVYGVTNATISSPDHRLPTQELVFKEHSPSASNLNQSQSASPRRSKRAVRENVDNDSVLLRKDAATDVNCQESRPLFVSPMEYFFGVNSIDERMDDETKQPASSFAKSSKETENNDCVSLERLFWDDDLSVSSSLQVRAFHKYENQSTLTNWSPQCFPKKMPAHPNPPLPPSMTNIDHLSSTEFTKDGLPVWQFTVYGGDDGALYYFKVFAKESLIPGAGYGAFLTFLGAKKLKSRSRLLNNRLMEHSMHRPHLEPKPLQALLEEGKSGVTVHLKGAGYDKHGRQYHPMSNLAAVIPLDHRRIRPGSLLLGGRQKIRVFGADLPSSIERKAYFVTDSNRRIGHLGIHVESDYRWDTEVTFPGLSDCIDLGRYGPFRVEDRKTDELFCLKDFIFSSEPAEWGFDVDEALDGSLQIVDITDDSTGKPHEIARGHLPMYVNEVGYNSKYTQNVFNCDESDRVVKYFFRPNRSLKRGETVELLTNYRDSYERSRERKGYGWRNLHEGLQGDCCLSQRIQRNFVDRADVEEIIHAESSVQKLSTYINFLNDKVWTPLVNKIETFLSNSDCVGVLSLNEWTAAVRIQWLTNAFRQKVMKYKACTTQDNLLNQLLIYKMTTTLDKIQSRAVDVNVFDEKKILDDKGKSVKDAIQNELIEEVGFYLQKDLPMLLDSSVYCPVAVRLIKKLSGIVSTSIIRRNKTSDHLIKQFLKEQMWNDFLEVALVALNELCQAIENFDKDGSANYSDLVFSSGILVKSSLIGPIQKALELVKCSNAFFLDNTTVSKGFRAALLDKIAYFEALQLSGIEPLIDTSAVEFQINEEIVMTAFTEISTHEELRDLGSAPRSVSYAMKRSTHINSTWYTVWQIFWPVHAFATKFLDSSVYSSESFSERLGISSEVSQFACKRGMRGGCNGELLYQSQIQQLLKSAHSFRAQTSFRAPTSLASELRKSTVAKRPRLPSKKQQATAQKTQHATAQKKQQATAQKKEQASSQKKQPATAQKKQQCDLVSPPSLVYEGEVLSFPEGFSSAGWTQKNFKRMSGESAGHIDRYWFTPSGNRLRSFAEILRYIAALTAFNGDEDEAYRKRNGGKHSA